jgi:hypothetical protein
VNWLWSGLIIATTLTPFAYSFPADASKPGVEKWTAVSTTALSITGSLLVSSERIVFPTGAALRVHRIGRVTASGWAETLNPARSEEKTQMTTLYRVDSRTNPRLIRGNTICGGKSGITYVGIRAEGDMRVLAAYDTVVDPTAVLSRRLEACATFYYNAAR